MRLDIKGRFAIVATLVLSSHLSAFAIAQPQPNYGVSRDIVYSEVEDTKLTLDAYVPSGKGPYPAVLVVHGGAWRSGSKSQLAGYARDLAEHGFVAFAINYRLAPKHKWPAQIEDCRQAVGWIRAHAAEYKVDPARLGAIGYSAGGHLVALLGTTGKAPSQDSGKTDLRIQAVVAGGAPVDFRPMPRNSSALSYWLGGTRAEVPDHYQQASPTAFVTSEAAPTFFYNGTKDSRVPPAFSRPMYEALKRVGVDSEFHELEGAGHLTAAMNQGVLDKAWKFLETHLQQKMAEAIGEE